MAGKFIWQYFSEVDLADVFFDSLKADYTEFPIWFQKKSLAGEKALVFHDETGVGAFIYLKKEQEEIELVDRKLPPLPRLKIGTLRLAERFRGLRLGEGAIGVSLWYWQSTKYDEIYVTVFEKHIELIRLFERFGFSFVGKNHRGERIYIKSKKQLSFSTPYDGFPFIPSQVTRAGIVPIYDYFHDRLFPYSELKGQNREIYEETAGNGISKIFIGTPSGSMHYKVGEPVFIYRIHTGEGQKTYKSAITSFCTISKIDIIRDNNINKLTLADFITMAGNKTVFSKDELFSIYNSKKPNIVMIEMVYNGFFGKGHNITHRSLDDQGLFSTYPYSIVYSIDQFKEILKMGDIDVANVIVD